MTWWQAIILGIIEGLTEFLPVSSTFHILFTGNLLNLEQTDFFKLFTVVIQAGAILAVIWLYGKELVHNTWLWKMLFWSFIPTAVVGFLGKEIITGTFFESTPLMLTAFIGVGIIFITYETWLAQRLERNYSLRELSIPVALSVGFAQALAVVPGVSRAGAVIFALLILGYKRIEAAKYSFLLALPTLGVAAAYDLFKEREVLLAQSSGLAMLLLGVVVAFVTALIVLKGFIHYLGSHTFIPFGLYRIAAGLLLVLFLY